MLRLMVRMGGVLLLAAAVTVCLSDATRSVATAHLVLTTTQQLLASGFASGDAMGPAPWSGTLGLIGPLTAVVRLLPACLPLAGAGLLLLAVGRRRAPGIGYIPR